MSCIWLIMSLDNLQQAYKKTMKIQNFLELSSASHEPIRSPHYTIVSKQYILCL